MPERKIHVRIRHRTAHEGLPLHHRRTSGIDHCIDLEVSHGSRAKSTSTRTSTQRTTRSRARTISSRPLQG
eukprot:6381314-Amphidinium_carterae.1